MEPWIKKIPWRRIPWSGNPLQYSCLENFKDRGAWQGYSPWGHRESDITEQLTLLFFQILMAESILTIGINITIKPPSLSTCDTTQMTDSVAQKNKQKETHKYLTTC